METCYGKPIADVGPPTAETETAAGRPTHRERDSRDKDTPGFDYGVIVYHGDGVHVVERTNTARYRDEVLTPFHAFYYAVTRLERFGPDIQP